MKIGIGIMACNEEPRIRATLESLCRQDLLQLPGTRGVGIEIIVVANGCRDRTVEVSTAAMAEFFTNRPGVAARTASLAQAGKSNAWNEYVHRLADPACDFLILMDGDITLVGDATLRLLVEALEAHPEAHVSVDVILKDLALKEQKTALEKLSVAASDLSRAGPPKIAGSLYCGWGAVLRGIWMPVGLLVEDGFLKAMIATDNFTRPENVRRVVRAEQAAHVFEAVTSPRILFKHEVRLLVGSAMNFILFDFLRARLAASGGDAGAIVRDLNAGSPGWFPQLMDEALRSRGVWVAPTGFVLLPLKQLRHLSLTGALLRLPAAMLRVGFNLAAAISANSQLRRRAFRW